jgi:hypothetical protein
LEEKEMQANVLKPFVFILVIMAVVSLACLGGSDTPSEAPPVQEEPQQEPEQPEEPEPAEQPEEPAEDPAPQSEAQQFFTEEFDGSNENWSFFIVDGSKDVPEFAGDDLEDSSLFTEDGLLIFDLVGEYLWVYAFYDPFEYENVSMEVVAENRGVNDNNISLICRYTEREGWYEFNIANNGLYWIYHGIINSDGQVIYSKLADGGSNRVNQGKEINTYGITCEDRTLTLYINGQETRQIDDNRFVLRDGQVGISVSSFQVLPVNVEIDYIDISEP